MSQEILAKLEEVLEEQRRQKRVLEDIQNELIELDKDHIVVASLKTQVAGMQDTVDEAMRDLKKFKQTMSSDIQEAVEEGVKPATKMASDVAKGLENGAIPITEKTAEAIKQDNFVRKFIKKWSRG